MVRIYSKKIQNIGKKKQIFFYIVKNIFAIKKTSNI